MSQEIDFDSFSLVLSEDEIFDLRARLANTRWPDELPNAGWDYGTNRDTLRTVCDHWTSHYDWEAFTARANAHSQMLTTIKGQRIHCIHARSPEPTARPLIITHGWPGSVAEFYDVIGPLSDPVRHGGDPADAYHVVCPSLPGYGFSGPTDERGWDATRTAHVFTELMSRLGYDRFFAQGGDWGSVIATSMAAHHPDRVAAFHVNLVTAGPPSDADDPMAGVTERERGVLSGMHDFIARQTGYQAIQSTKPQTLGYGLNDSPAGLTAWILEKFQTWSDGADMCTTFDINRLLDNLSIYWLTGTINSSMRMYYETLGPGRMSELPAVTVPMGHTVYPGEIYGAPRVWVEAAFDVFYWSEEPEGGHFVAMEVPDAFVADLRACFRGRSV